MPVSKLSLADALKELQGLGRARILVGNGGATAQLEGPLAFDQTDGDLLLKVGCACGVRIARERVRHAVVSEKDSEGKLAAHVQLFDGNYDKLVAFAFPDGIPAAQKLIAKLDGNDFEIG
jgi:hypothetical protein